MKYKLKITPKADKDIQALKRSEPNAFKKLYTLLYELTEHPKTGTGKPEILRKADGIYSRRITQKHRLVYLIDDDFVIVLVISAYGHYNDK